MASSADSPSGTGSGSPGAGRTVTAEEEGERTPQRRITYHSRSNPGKTFVVETEFLSMRFKERGLEEEYTRDVAARSVRVARLQLTGIILFATIFGGVFGRRFDFVPGPGRNYGTWILGAVFALLLLLTFSSNLYMRLSREIATAMATVGSVWIVQFCVLVLTTDEHLLRGEGGDDEKQYRIVVLLMTTWPALSWLPTIPNINFHVATYLAVGVIVAETIAVAVVYEDGGIVNWASTLFVALAAIDALHSFSGSQNIWNDRRAFVLLTKLEEENITVEVTTQPSGVYAWLREHTDGILHDRAGGQQQFWSIKMADVTLVSKIGAGGFGDVYKGKWRGTTVAVKMLRQSMTGDMLRDFVREVCIMIELRHPNILLVMGACVDPSQMFILTEFMDGGSLFQLLHTPSVDMPEPRRVELCVQIVSGLVYLHNSTPALIHRDVKSLNVLVDSRWHAKLCDFGLTQFKAEGEGVPQQHFGGSVYWTAPELLKSSVYGTAMAPDAFTEETDIYALGVVMWEVFTRREPFLGMTPNDVAMAVVTRGLRPDITAADKVAPPIRAIIEMCWAQNPSRRPKADALADALAAARLKLLPPAGAGNSRHSVPRVAQSQAVATADAENKSQKSPPRGSQHRTQQQQQQDNPQQQPQQQQQQDNVALTLPAPPGEMELRDTSSASIN